LDHINQSLDNKDIVATARCVYGALTQSASDSASSTFITTIARIAATSGVADRTVRKRLHDLRDIGLIHIELASLKAPAKYTILAFGNKCRTNGHNDRSIGRPNRTSGNGALSARMPTLEEREKGGRSPLPPSNKGDDDEKLYALAEGIYAAYPRKIARGKALVSIKRAFETVDPEILLGAVIRYAKLPEHGRENGRYVPSPVTWFAEERWKDYLPKATPPTAEIPRPSKALEDLRLMWDRRPNPSAEERGLIMEYVKRLTPTDFDFLNDEEHIKVSSLCPKTLRSGGTGYNVTA
jgi:hypothetical protein